MDNKQKAKIVVKSLKKVYGDEIPCYLHYHKNKPYEFLFAVMLSAQCTDLKVNEVTKNLFKKYSTLKAFSNANVKKLEKDIYSIGYYKNKSKNIIETANILLEKYGGKVPSSFNDLISLKGVGRKTANVVLGSLYEVPSMAVDTHVNRISNRLFNLNSKNPDAVEEKLKQIVDKKDWVLWNTHIIAFGRDICKAQNPKCEICFLKKICSFRL